MFGPNVNRIFCLELPHCKFDFYVTVHFPIANLVNLWTAFPVPVVFEFRFPCFKMSLCCWHFLWCQFIFDTLLTFSALVYVFMAFCHCQELTEIGVKSATTILLLLLLVILRLLLLLIPILIIIVIVIITIIIIIVQSSDKFIF